MNTQETIDTIQETIQTIPTSALELSSAIALWADRTFPRETDDIGPIIAHWKKENIELLEVISAGESGGWTFEHYIDAIQEAADIVILLTHLVHRLGGNLGGAVIYKHIVNLNRKWGEPDEEGVVEHID